MRYINNRSPAQISSRIFLTCWLIFVIHFATNIVREIYPALALGDHFSFRLDEYANMHPDLFNKEGYGWHIGNNPGVSLLAAIPYALSRPIIDPIVERVNQSRTARGDAAPPSYTSQWPMAREFYMEAWKRGLDVKFVLAAFVMQAFCMAPISALSAVIMFYLLLHLFRSKVAAAGLAFLYALGTPVFFRTGYLNQNLMMGIIAFSGFLVLWNYSDQLPLSKRTRYFLGGLAGGTSLLFDYSGLVLLVGLFMYGLIKEWRENSIRSTITYSIWYILGAVAPVGILWFYQWRSFGNPFFPGQHWMPPVEWIELGYQGYGLPQLELFLMLGFDFRFGLFVSTPLMLLSLAAPFVNRGKDKIFPAFEMYVILVLLAAFWIFFSGSNYVRLQFNTGIRYMTPMLPFLFPLAAIVLMKLPRLIIALIVWASFIQSWALAMYRQVESNLGMLEPLSRFLTGGFQLPALRTLSNLEGVFGWLFPNGISALPILSISAALIWIIWMPNPMKKFEHE